MHEKPRLSLFFVHVVAQWSFTLSVYCTLRAGILYCKDWCSVKTSVNIHCKYEAASAILGWLSTLCNLQCFMVSDISSEIFTVRCTFACNSFHFHSAPPAMYMWHLPCIDDAALYSNYLDDICTIQEMVLLVAEDQSNHQTWTTQLQIYSRHCHVSIAHNALE